MTIKGKLPADLIAQVDSGVFADRINSHRTEGEQLEATVPLVVRYLVVDKQMSYAKAGVRVGLTGERVRQIANQLGIKSRYSRTAAPDKAPRRARS